MLKRVKDAMAKRRNVADNFRTENGFSWDYVMVFKVYDADDELTPDQQKSSLKNILADLASGGLETRLFYSVQVFFHLLIILKNPWYEKYKMHCLTVTIRFVIGGRGIL